jgi:streptomycin 6-kinase
MNDRLLIERVEERVRQWNVDVLDTLETESSVVAFGTRGNLPVVLKVIRQLGDEWRCGEVLEAFDGIGVVRVYDYIEGAVLLERLNPATSLAALALEGRDDEATEILAEVIDRMSHPLDGSKQFVRVEDWGRAFEGYQASGDKQIQASLVERGGQLYSQLSKSQRDIRLLHGDLHHYNVLFDYDRGWIAIDPKGVVGEIEYEIGASLRNPYEKPEVFATAETVQRRVKLYGTKLKLDTDRALRWTFAQAVLSAIWSVEDGFEVDCNNPAIRLANAMLPLLN